MKTHGPTVQAHTDGNILLGHIYFSQEFELEKCGVNVPFKFVGSGGSRQIDCSCQVPKMNKTGLTMQRFLSTWSLNLGMAWGSRTKSKNVIVLYLSTFGAFIRVPSCTFLHDHDYKCMVTENYICP